MLSAIANSVDPDQTSPWGAVWSGSALLTYVNLLAILVYEILGHLPYTLTDCTMSDHYDGLWLTYVRSRTHHNNS